MTTITLDVAHARGALPGTSRWLLDQLAARRAALRIGETRKNSPACFLAWEDADAEGKSARKSLTLACYTNYYQQPEVQVLGYHDLDPDPYHLPVMLFGAVLTPGARKIFDQLVARAVALLEDAIAHDDGAGAATQEQS